MLKVYFIRWFQRIWSSTVGSRQIQAAWTKAYLYPRPSTPEQIAVTQTELQTPQTSQTLQALKRQLGTNEISRGMASRKFEKAAEQSLAREALSEQDNERREDAQAMNEEAERSYTSKVPSGLPVHFRVS